MTELRGSGLVRSFGSRKAFGGSRKGPVAAVAGVDINLRTGDRLGVVGESGSGKSTLLRLLAALDRPTAGEVWFGADRVDNLPDRRLGFFRSALQVVFQDPRSSLNPRMRVGDIVTEPLRSLRRLTDSVSADRHGRRDQVLTEVGLDPEVANRYPHEFSGGQRQRIAIARALAPRPQILLADEPVSALDVSARAQILNLLLDLVRDHGLTLIFVSHDLSVVRHVCSTVMVMRAGKVIEEGKTEQVFNDPQAPYTAELLAAIPRFDAAEE